MNDSTIKNISALEILDSRGNPTVEAYVKLESGEIGWAAVPSGTSTGSHEALELRDNDKSRYQGKGVLKAVQNISTTINRALQGKDVHNQQEIDTILINLDGTPNKSSLGANAILAVSLSVAQTAAKNTHLELYQYLRQTFWPEEKSWQLPVPLFNVLNGGKHAPGSVDLQEFMLMPVGSPSFSAGLQAAAEVFHTLKKILLDKGLPVGVGDEGGFMPKMTSHREVLKLLAESVTTSGYSLGKDFIFALDPAATEVYAEGKYILKTEGQSLTSEGMIALYRDWITAYPIRSIEDGLAEDDWEGFTSLTKTLGAKIQIVGDDLFVTNSQRLKKGIELKAANSILVKLNQIGTLTETIEVINTAHKAGMTAIISHRSGETEDTFIADLAVAANCGQIKSGAPNRTERVAKYNHLLRIEKQLGDKAQYARFPFV